MNKKNTTLALVNTALFLTIANFAGKCLGFFRDILISNYYGATSQTDALFLALSIPTILIGIFTSSADSSIVPQYSKIKSSEEGRFQADIYFSNIITHLTIIATLAAVICLVFPEVVIFLFSPSFTGEALAYSCRYLRIFSLAGLFHIWFCFFCAYLLCFQKTSIRILLCVSTNVIVVLSLLLIHDTGMYALSIAYMIGSILCAVLPMLHAFRLGYRYRPVLSKKKYHFPEFFKLFLPIMGSALLADLLLYSDRFLSSFLSNGSLSALNYGSKITGIFENVFVIGIGAVLLPLITRLQIGKKKAQMQFTTTAVSFVLIIFLCPLAMLCILYSYDMVSVLYLRGAFTQQNAQIVSTIFQGYSFLILFSPLQMTLTKIFHGMGDTKLPFRISLVTFMSNIILSIVFMQFMGVLGIALATTISALIGCSFLLVSMHKKIGLMKTFFSWKTSLKIVVCILIMCVPSCIFPELQSSFMNLLILGGCSVLFYLIAVFIIFKQELILCKKAILNFK